MDLMIKHNLSDKNDIIIDVTKLIEGQLKAQLVAPISEKLESNIRSKIATLSSAWSKLSSDAYKELFRKEIAKRSFKIQVPACDLTDDSLVSRFEMVQEQFNDSRLENGRLEKTIKDLNAELNELKAKLSHTRLNVAIETGRQASLKALETIAQAEQVSALATIDLQAKLAGKRHTIRNIITEPDIIELADGGQSLNTSLPTSELIDTAGLSNSPNFTNFILQTRRRIEREKYRELKDKEKVEFVDKSFPTLTKLVKFSQRKNYYLVGERQRGRLKTQIKGNQFKR